MKSKKLKFTLKSIGLPYTLNGSLLMHDFVKACIDS
jgi:hypothetical protein